LTDTVFARLREAEKLLGVPVVDASVEAALAGDDVATVLVAGARVCFTGTALDSDGREVPRERMERMAADAGLAPVKSVTKTRCEVLVTAEAGTQSGKARKAVELGKPVLSADQFFAWVTTR
jgi:NAD-dependent DNA ligase